MRGVRREENIIEMKETHGEVDWRRFSSRRRREGTNASGVEELREVQRG